MWNYETRTTTYEADLETVQFLDNLEESIIEYWKLKGYTDEQLVGIDFQSNIHNSIISLFRHGGISPKTFVEYITLTVAYTTTETLNPEHKSQYDDMTNKICSRINNIMKNSLEG